jgi:hypothetical protein
MNYCIYCRGRLDNTGTLCLECGLNQNNENVKLTRDIIYVESNFKGRKIKHSPDFKVFYPFA